jgi:hypothetical protein
MDATPSQVDADQREESGRGMNWQKKELIRKRL